MNHRVFERTLRSLVFRGARLFECHEICQAWDGLFCLSISLGCWALPCPLLGRLALKALADPCVALVRLSVIIYLIAEDIFQDGQSSFGLLLNLVLQILESVFHFSALTSNQVGLPAELKHINKRRKRN